LLTEYCIGSKPLKCDKLSEKCWSRKNMRNVRLHEEVMLRVPVDSPLTAAFLTDDFLRAATQ